MSKTSLETIIYLFEEFSLIDRNETNKLYVHITTADNVDLINWRNSSGFSKPENKNPISFIKEDTKKVYSFPGIAPRELVTHYWELLPSYDQYSASLETKPTAVLALCQPSVESRVYTEDDKKKKTYLWWCAYDKALKPKVEEVIQELQRRFANQQQLSFGQETHNSPAAAVRDPARFPCDFPGKQ